MQESRIFSFTSSLMPVSASRDCFNISYKKKVFKMNKLDRIIFATIALSVLIFVLKVQGVSYFPSGISKIVRIFNIFKNKYKYDGSCVKNKINKKIGLHTHTKQYHIAAYCLTFIITHFLHLLSKQLPSLYLNNVLIYFSHILPMSYTFGIC